MIRFAVIGWAMLAGAAIAADDRAITGTATIIDGRTIEVAGHTIRLSGINVPPLGTACKRNGKPFDCGVISASQLADITAAAKVSCRLDKGDGDEPAMGRCDANGYDLAGGMVYSGWAWPNSESNEDYIAKLHDSRTRKRGIWAFDDPLPVN